MIKWLSIRFPCSVATKIRDMPHSVLKSLNFRTVLWDQEGTLPSRPVSEPAFEELPVRPLLAVSRWGRG